MKLRPATIHDYLELVEMFKELIATVYDGLEIGEEIFFHRTVHSWFTAKRNVIISETDDGIITGFTVGYIEDIGIVKPYYYGDLAFVKEKYRRGRSAYLLYNNVVDYAEQLNLPLMAKAFVTEENKDKVDKIQARWGKPRFVEYYKGIKNG
jgi:hypothetical protein